MYHDFYELSWAFVGSLKQCFVWLGKGDMADADIVAFLAFQEDLYNLLLQQEKATMEAVAT